VALRLVPTHALRLGDAAHGEVPGRVDAERLERSAPAVLRRHVEDERRVEVDADPAPVADLVVELPRAPARVPKEQSVALGALPFGEAVIKPLRGGETLRWRLR